MKAIRILRLFCASLLVVTLVAGCTSEQARQAARVATSAAQRASQAADEARAAQQAARMTTNTDEIARLLNQADNAARRAKQEAEEAERWLQSIDDPGLRLQTKPDVQQAQQSIEELLRSVQAAATVDDATNNIIRRSNITVEPGPEQSEVQQKVRDVVLASACDVFVERMAIGTFPTPEETQGVVLEHSANAALKLLGVSEIAIAILTEINVTVNQLPEDELAEVKEHCESLINP